MRFIDADELLKIIDKTFYTTEKHNLNDLEYGFNSGLNKAIKLIEEQPTAYDVDKVVKNLEEYLSENGSEDNSGFIEICIEIVKDGGIIEQ